MANEGIESLQLSTPEDNVILVRVVIQHFSKNTVISMVLGHPNSEITCIPPS